MKRSNVWSSLVAAGALAAVGTILNVAGCGGGVADTSPIVCEPGEVQVCPCADGTSKVQACKDDGTGWQACQCSDGIGGAGGGTSNGAGAGGTGGSAGGGEDDSALGDSGYEPSPGEDLIGGGECIGAAQPLMLKVPWLAQSPPGTWSKTLNCGPTTYAMVDGYLTGATPTADTIKLLDDWMASTLANWSKNNYNGSYTSTAQLGTVAKDYGSYPSSTKFNGATCEDLKSELAAGRPVIVVVDTQTGNNYPSTTMKSGSGHFMVVVGIDGDFVYMNDPGRSAPINGCGANTEGECTGRKFTLSSFNAIWGKHGRAGTYVRSGQANCTCGNGTCESQASCGETCASCELDCGCANGKVCQSGLCVEKCGNGTCDVGENCGSCVADCACGGGQACQNGMCGDQCGNGVCDAGETCAGCPAECGCQASQVCQNNQCVPKCGNGTCDAGEGCGTCAGDCTCQANQVCQNNQCVQKCGNGVCDAGEGCGTCAGDCTCQANQVCQNNQCVQKCGNGTCDAGENCGTCAGDCVCGGGQVCMNQSCQSCGSSGQPCCNGTCNGALVCNAGTCGVCTPTVTGVMPLSVTLYQTPTFTISGSCLPANITAFIPECSGLQMLTSTPTQATFKCTPSFSTGVKSGVIKDAPGGNVLYSFNVNVGACSPLVNSVTPNTATLNQNKTFTISGSCLPDTITAFIPECQNLTVNPPTGDHTQTTFNCTPGFSTGVKMGLVKNMPGGTTLKTFTVTVN